MIRDKVRIRFRKTGDLRLVSHHDLMRCWERLLRRAAIPFRSTEGFNPKPRLSFPLSLALGIVGCQEVAELELAAELPPAELLDRLRSQAPPGLEFLELRRIDPRASGQVCRVRYRVSLLPAEMAGLPERVSALLAAAEIPLERTLPQPRRLDLRPYLESIDLFPDALEMQLRVTPNGTARPNEILRLLDRAEVLDRGAVLERITVELDDEIRAPETIPDPAPAPVLGVTAPDP